VLRSFGNELRALRRLKRRTQLMTCNVLFLCTGNSARSILAEALLGVLGKGRFEAYSAGSHPGGRVQPIAAELATKLGYPAEKMRSKSWDEYAVPGAPRMDFIITVCDNAAGEVCPIWPGQPITAHWGVPDPAAVQGSEEERRAAFRDAFVTLRRRVELLIALPIDKLDRMARERELRAIADFAK
jgi:arsenate reductase